MKMFIFIKGMIIRIFIIILGILTAIVLTHYVVVPYILKPMCLVDSNGCSRIEYYKFNNSFLAEMKYSGIWVWFNGDKIFVYGQPVGQICDTNYEAAYSINPSTGLKEGYACVLPLEKVIKFYTDKNLKTETIVKRTSNDFDVYNLFNLFIEKGIININ